MIQINPIFLLLFGELLLVTTIVSVVLIALSVARNRGDRAAVRKLVSHIKEDDAQRKEETRKIIQERYGLQNEMQDDLLFRIDKQEKLFYQNLVNLYLKRNATALEKLHINFHQATEPYRSIELPSNATSGEPNTAVTEDEAVLMEQKEAEIARLSDENHRLSEELKITMEAMGRMLKEYANMYGGKSNPSEPKQMTAMITEQEEESVLSKQDESANHEISETLDDSTRLNSDPDDIDYLIEDATLHGRDNQAQGQEKKDLNKKSDKDDELDDLEVMPENEAVVNHSDDEIEELDQKN